MIAPHLVSWRHNTIKLMIVQGTEAPDCRASRLGGRVVERSLSGFVWGENVYSPTEYVNNYHEADKAILAEIWHLAWNIIFHTGNTHHTSHSLAQAWQRQKL